MEITAYRKASSYENIIRKSLNSPDSMRNFKALNAYRALTFFMEDQKVNASEKQFAILKSYLVIAINKFLKRRLHKDKKDALRNLVTEIDNTAYLFQIDSIIEQVLEMMSTDN